MAIDCGGCSAGSTCSLNSVCVACPPSCSSLGWQCGSGPDGCGGALACPSCPSGRPCGASHRCDD
jgi:hypothetical protein